MLFFFSKCSTKESHERLKQNEILLEKIVA